MRFIISAIGTVLALSLFVPTPSVAQTAQNQSMSQLTNSCIDLARQRGWTESDIARQSSGDSEFRSALRTGQRGARAAEAAEGKR